MSVPANIAYSLAKGYKKIDSKKQMFLDNDLVAVVKNIKRTLHEPSKHPQNPLIRQDKPWERLIYFRTNAYNVIYDEADKLFKCWYDDRPAAEQVVGQNGKMIAKEKDTAAGCDLFGSRICMAISKDGINWEKPGFGKVVEDGHNTNVVFFDDKDPKGGIYAMSVLLDPNESDLLRRYKAIYCHVRPNWNVPKVSTQRDMHSVGWHLAFSPNGVDWTKYEDNPIITECGSDVVILTWDPVDKKYVLMCRAVHEADSPHPDFDNWYTPFCPDQPPGVWCPRRRVDRMESEDCIHWSSATLVSSPRPEDDLQEAHYGLLPWRVDDYHLGFLNILQQVDNTFHFELIHSRDGLNWNRFTPRRPVIPAGGPGSFDEFMVECPNTFLTIGDKHWIYYGGNSCHHDWWIPAKDTPDVPETRDPSLVQHHLGLAKIRLDGWVSLDAFVREGYVETKPVWSAGAKLIINGKCNSGGHIMVEVMDNWDNVWDGFSRKECDVFTGDAVNHVVSWQGRTDVNSIPGIVKLRFHLKNAELYSFRIADE